MAAIKDISNDIAILEHVTDVEIPPYFEIIKQKKYGEKFVTFLRYNNIRS